MSDKQYDVIVVGGGMGGTKSGCSAVPMRARECWCWRRADVMRLADVPPAAISMALLSTMALRDSFLRVPRMKIYRRIGKEMPENVCEWTNHGQIYVDGEWRSLSEDVIGASFEEFMRVYKETAMKITWEEIEELNDISTEAWVQSMTDDQKRDRLFPLHGLAVRRHARCAHGLFYRLIVFTA